MEVMFRSDVLEVISEGGMEEHSRSREGMNDGLEKEKEAARGENSTCEGHVQVEKT